MMEGPSTEIGLGSNPAPDLQTNNPSRTEEWSIPLDSDSLHELAGPVSRVCSLVALLFKKYGCRLDDDAGMLFGLIDKSTTRLQDLLDGLEKYTQVVGSPGPHRHCDTGSLLDDSVQSIRRAIDENHAAVTHDALPELYCDPIQLQFAFASLIENSIKFRSEARPMVHVSAVSKETTWVFSVQDNGIGIAPKNHDRIFGVFTKVHQEVYPGAGVGLAIVRRVIEQHHGRIWVESGLGHGTTFFFSLPRREHAKDCAVA